MPRNLAKESTQLFRCSAAIMPRATPISAEMETLRIATRNVVGQRSKMVVVIFLGLR